MSFKVRADGKNVGAKMKLARGGDGQPIVISAYEPNHLAGIISLHCAEYGGDPNTLRQKFENFYEDLCQRERCVRVVALKDDRIVGFQSLFYWPIAYDGVQLWSLQSGNSVVAKECRGQGVFGRLLRYQENFIDPTRTDCLIGFPVDASLGSFVRNGWQHIVDLVWYGRVVAPFSAYRPINEEALRRSFEFKAHVPQGALYAPGRYAVALEPAFLRWRSKFRRPGVHFYFHDSAGSKEIRFDLRLEQRGRIKILVIGGIVATDCDPQLVRNGLRKLIGAAAASRSVTLLAIARNEHADEQIPVSLLRRNMFFRLRQKSHFVAKPVACREPSLIDTSRWHLCRGDIDTW